MGKSLEAELVSLSDGLARGAERQVAEALRKKYSKDELDQASGDAALRSYLDYNSLCDVVFPGDFNSYVSRLLLVLSDASNVAAGEIPHPEVERRAMGRAGAADKRDRAMKERALVASMRGVDQKKTVGEELRTANAMREAEAESRRREVEAEARLRSQAEAHRTAAYAARARQEAAGAAVAASVAAQRSRIHSLVASEI